MTPIYYIAVFFVFHCFFLSKCGKILFAAKHGGGFFGFLGFCRFKKNRAVGGGGFFSHGAEKGRTAERRAGFDFIPKRMKRNSENYSLASSGSKRLCRLRKSRQSGREKIAVSATCGAITV